MQKLDAIQAKYGVTHGKGQVTLVGKEVDHAIPSITVPYVFVMSLKGLSADTSRIVISQQVQSQKSEKDGPMLDYDQVIQGDCLDVLAQIPDNSVDVCFADPPFNLDKKYTSYRDERSLDEYIAWCEQWLLELVRVTKPTGSILVHNIPR